MALLDEPDAGRWQDLGGRVAARLEGRLRPPVLGNRAAVGPNGWRLRPVGLALRRARHVAAGIAAASPAVLRTDIAAFYPSVLPETLHHAVLATGANAGDAAAAAGLLEEWGSHGYPGLPIGPPASAVMANAVLCPVDEALAPLRFARWVDDYLIGLPDPGKASKVVERLDDELDRLGLRRSGEKTAVVSRARPLRWLGASLMP